MGATRRPCDHYKTNSNTKCTHECHIAMEIATTGTTTNNNTISDNDLQLFEENTLLRPPLDLTYKYTFNQPKRSPQPRNGNWLSFAPLNLLRPRHTCIKRMAYLHGTCFGEAAQLLPAKTQSSYLAVCTSSPHVPASCLTRTQLVASRSQSHASPSTGHYSSSNHSSQSNSSSSSCLSCCSCFKTLGSLTTSAMSSPSFVAGHSSSSSRNLP